MEYRLDESALIGFVIGRPGTITSRINDKCLLDRPLKERCKVPGATEETAEQASSLFACC